jgi:hypothetical protein
MIEIDKVHNKTHLKTKPATEPYPILQLSEFKKQKIYLEIRDERKK